MSSAGDARRGERAPGIQPASRHVLVIDDDPVIVPVQVRQAFSGAEYRVSVATSGRAGLERVLADPPGVILLDLGLPDEHGLATFQRIKAIDARIPVIFITMAKTANAAIEAMKEGAFNYLHKPLHLRELVLVVEEAFQVARRMQTEVVLSESSSQENDDGDGDAMFGACPAMLETYKAIGRVAAQDVSVLIMGESGTGKELVARAIYQHGRRAKAPFLALNCAAIPENLLESELFGHEKGAFTGADRRRIGKFEQCHGGTLLLDEIGDMPLALQAKLLRVLQERTFERVGGNETLRTDVRVIASTHRDLKASVTAGLFRSDLYYRLAVFTIQLPSLRERGDDLGLLVGHYVRQFSAELGREVSRVAPDALEILYAYSWPGNIRELQSVLKQALLRASGVELLSAFLPELAPSSGTRARSASSAPPASMSRQADPLGIDLLIDREIAKESNDLYAAAHRAVDRHVFTRVLTHTRGNQREAARILGIARQTMRVKLRALGLQLSHAVDGQELDEDEEPSRGSAQGGEELRCPPDIPR